MIKISQQQIGDLTRAEFTAVGVRIISEWPNTSARLYPQHALISNNDQRYWVKQAIEASLRWDIDNEEAIISLATNVLSAWTLGLSRRFIEDMSAYFLVCAVNDADYSLAQEWIAWVLFEQQERIRTKAA
jgi:hypothetical protein